MPKVTAEPYEFEFDPQTTALIIIDMQRDFVEPGGFGEALGNDVSFLRLAVEPLQRVLAATRAAGMLVIHTREGHRPDLSDCPPAKLARGRLDTGIGDQGPMGRILVRGEYGHDIVDELKPPRASRWSTSRAKARFTRPTSSACCATAGITSLMVTGVTAEVCVHTTVREANDRGYECLVLDGLHRLVLPRVSRDDAEDGQGAGRHLRLGRRRRPGRAAGSDPRAKQFRSVKTYILRWDRC